MHINDLLKLATFCRKTRVGPSMSDFFIRMAAGPRAHSRDEDGGAPFYAASTGGDAVACKRVPLLAFALTALASFLVIAGPQVAHGQDESVHGHGHAAYDVEAAGLTVTMSADDQVVWQKNGKTTLRFTLSRPLETGESVRVSLTVLGGQVDKHWNLKNHAGTAVKRVRYGKMSALEIGPGGQEATLQFVGRNGDRNKDRDITIRFGKGKRPPRAVGIDGPLKLQGSPLTITVAREKPTAGSHGTVTPPPAPTITISSGAGVTEGETARFTITASPQPRSPIMVNIGVNQSGDYGAMGASAVSVSSSTTTYTVSTDDDEVDEADGSVTATVKAGQGYTVGSTASATAVVADNDEPSVVTIETGEWVSIVEGREVPFVIKAEPAPTSPITVNVKVTEDGDFGASGAKTVTVTKAETDYIVSTIDDDKYEVFGSVRATIMPGTGYVVGSPSIAGVTLWDNDAPPPLRVSITSDTDTVEEGKSVTFTLTAAPAPAADMDVTVKISSLAIADYGVKTGIRTVTIPTSGSASFKVATSDDNVDEVDGAVSATIKPSSDYTTGSLWTKTVSVTDNDEDTFRVLLHNGIRGYSIIEGMDALYIIEVLPAPTGPLTVNIELTEDGDFGASGAKSLTVTESETTYRVSTTDDDVDEPNGSVRAKIMSGKGYVPGWPSAVTINVADNDGTSTSLVSGKGGGSITEGETATFTLTAEPAPTAPLSVPVQVTEIDVSGVAIGQRTVTIPTSGSATLSVATGDVDDSNGYGIVRVTVMAGHGYLVKSPNTSRVFVWDDD